MDQILKLITWYVMGVILAFVLLFFLHRSLKKRFTDGEEDSSRPHEEPPQRGR